MKRLILILLCLVAAACAVTEVLQPGPSECCDSFVWQQEADWNYDYLDFFDFGYDEGFVLALLRFAELDDPRFDDCEVEVATLALRPITDAGWGTPPMDCHLRRIVEDWDEETVTWNNQPDYDDPTLDFSYTSDSGWLYVDVTEIVRNWLEDGEPNHGFIFGPQGSDYCGALVYSGEYSDNPDWRPALQIRYTPETAVEQVSWGEIKALD
jgi:hypothetical protein